MSLSINRIDNSSVNLTSKDPVGPLAELYKNRYKGDNLSYPRDLGSSYRGHSVGFQFVKVQPAGLAAIESAAKTAVTATVAAVGVTAAATVAAGSAGAAATNSVPVAIAAAAIAGGTTAVGLVTMAANEVLGTETVQNAMKDDGTGTTGISMNPQMEQPSATVRLYMPDTLEFSYESNYTDLSLGDALGESILTSNMGGRAITSVIQDPATRLALNKAGYVFNPQQQMLFNGIDFRTYQMTFTFTPYSRTEAQEVKNIIQTFRKYAAPTVVTEAAGFFFNPPGMVDVTFYKDNKENTNLHKLKRSVLESVTVNYAPNGWAAMEDGMPMQTTMTLSFKEVQLVDSKDIARGY